MFICCVLFLLFFYLFVSGDNFSSGLSGTALGVYSLGVYIGYSGSLSLGTFMTDELGWESGYYAFGFAGIVLGVLAALLVEDPRYPSIFPSKNKDVHYSSNMDTERLMGDVSEEETEEGVGRRQKGSLSDVWITTKEIFSHWWATPAIVAICVASAFRNGAGYVWAYYSAVFFSDKWEYDPDHDGTCWFSNTNSSWDGGCGGAPECCGDDYPYCVSGSCGTLSEFPWHNEGMSSKQFQSYISWVPFIGMAMGSMFGGHLSDILVSKRGFKARHQLLTFTNIISAPLVYLVLYLDYPWCFLVWIPAGFIGEAWIGTAIASVLDLTPSHLVVFSTSIYMFFLTIIGGEMPLLV